MEYFDKSWTADHGTLWNTLYSDFYNFPVNGLLEKYNYAPPPTFKSRSQAPAAPLPQGRNKRNQAREEKLKKKKLEEDKDYFKMKKHFFTFLAHNV